MFSPSLAHRLLDDDIHKVADDVDFIEHPVNAFNFVEKWFQINSLTRVNNTEGMKPCQFVCPTFILCLKNSENILNRLSDSIETVHAIRKQLFALILKKISASSEYLVSSIFSKTLINNNNSLNGCSIG